ncbi:hypothetical protein SLS55_001084 [Diplodia seriata]|uniref:Uncharacterized protein n=1 Tax=Diplodia seriata TaxID=420778 RepID=A0ABR3CW48_9PEZI
MRAHGIDVDAEVAAHTDSNLVLSHGTGTGAETAEFEDLCVAFEGALSFDESLNFDQDGELRYFGPTSGRLDFHPCGHNGTDSSATHAPKSSPRDAKSSPLSPSAEDDTFPPEDVKEELISLYFLYVQPWHQVDVQGVVKIPSDAKPSLLPLISLSRILEKILMGLYAPKPTLKGPQKAQFLSHCILELKNWFYDLPSEMRIDRPSEKRPPQVYTMHMVYHNSFILLMKPFLGKEQQRLEKPGSSEPNNNDMAKKAAAICYEASRQMVLVTRKYRHAYGSFRRSPITATYCSLSAALTLLQISKLDSVVEAAGKTRHIARMVEACLEVLQELSTSWDIARRLRESLVKLYQQFISSNRISSGGKVTSQIPGSAAGNAGKVPDDDVPPLTSPTDDPLPFFLEDPSAEVGGYATLGDFTEEMLLDESLWESAGQDLAFDPLQSDYMGAGSLDRWRFDDIW